MFKFIEQAYGVNTQYLKSVEVVPMDATQQRLATNVVRPKRCFDNCFELAHSLDATYVLGFYFDGHPIEHAWLKVDGEYIDPTLELVMNKPKGTYFSLAEISASELIDFICTIDGITDKGAFPPMLSTVISHPDCKERFVSRTRFSLAS